MEFCKDFPAYKLEEVDGEISILTWQRWLVFRASRRMAEEKDNYDDWGDDYDEPGDNGQELDIKPKEGETEQDAEIRRFIQGGKSGGGH